MELKDFISARIEELRASPTPGREALDNLRFELKKGDQYEQHLSSRIEDGLDSQTRDWDSMIRLVTDAMKSILDFECFLYPKGSHPATQAMRYLGSIWSEHPDYDPKWAVKDVLGG